MNSLNALVKTSILKIVEVFIDHLVDLLRQDIVHSLQQGTTRCTPPFSGRLDEPFRDDV